MYGRYVDFDLNWQMQKRTGEKKKTFEEFPVKNIFLKLNEQILISDMEKLFSTFGCLKSIGSANDKNTTSGWTFPTNVDHFTDTDSHDLLTGLPLKNNLERMAAILPFFKQR